MDKKRIGIYYNCSDSWIGGKYYYDSIITCLKQNPNNELIFLKRPILLRIIGKIFGKNSNLYLYHLRTINNKARLDVVFPYIRDYYCGKKNISWIPDFQENYYPDFFDIEDICSRMNNHTRIAYSDNILILSSYSAKADFERLYPKHYCKVEVLQFVSSLVNTRFYEDENILEKYHISEPFFICSNQMWKHKNHIVVVKAIEKIKKEGKHVLCLFTGKEEDNRNPSYPAELKQMVKDLQLDNEIMFLGFIPRKDQIELMKKSIAVVQPSLFEGWNTTIEDSKVLGKKLIVSDIRVQIEQLEDKGIYFKSNDYEDLAKILLKLNTNPPNPIDYNYSEQVFKYAEMIKKIF